MGLGCLAGAARGGTRGPRGALILVECNSAYPGKVLIPGECSWAFAAPLIHPEAGEFPDLF
jgi:hypothetical protein